MGNCSTKSKQSISYPNQQNRFPGFHGLVQTLLQFPEIVKVKTTAGQPKGIHPQLDHVDKGGVAPLQIGRQQSENAVILPGKKLPEALQGAPVVDRQIPHIVPGRSLTSRAAALKNPFRGPVVTDSNRKVFVKGNGQGNRPFGFNAIGKFPQDRVVSVLIGPKFFFQIFKGSLPSKHPCDKAVYIKIGHNQFPFLGLINNDSTFVRPHKNTSISILNPHVPITQHKNPR